MWVIDDTERDLHVEARVAPAPFSVSPRRQTRFDVGTPGSGEISGSPGATASSLQTRLCKKKKHLKADWNPLHHQTHHLSSFP